MLLFKSLNSVCRYIVYEEFEVYIVIFVRIVFQIFMEFMLPILLSKEWAFKPHDSTTLAVQMPKNFGMKKMVQLKLGLCRKLMLVKKLQSTTAHLKFL